MTYDPMPAIYAAVGWPVFVPPLTHTIKIATANRKTFGVCTGCNWHHESVGTNNDVYRYVVAQGKAHREGVSA